ncbi:unnamed protein product [Lactuca virosa]|uniref:Uncharacterized protein n=1 Tax=Lactuca virosa TaxID=75947 RepID=A0AAU9PGR7_9ASTR|nr:unnamed protein product [Lactuca virosa]
MAPKSKFLVAFEEVEISDDEEEEVQEKDMTENELEDFLQSISFPEEDVDVTPSAVTERDRDSNEQFYSPTPEQMDALSTELQQTARKPPQADPVTSEPPSEKGAQASGSSFEAPKLDISKGKSKLPEFEFVDVALLQSRLFDLEQSSTEKDLIIGKQDIRLCDIEKEKSIKDAKISELQENLGGLTALFFDLKQRLHKKFGDDFQPLSAEGEKISASSSGPVNPSSQPASERVIRPALDANLDTLLFSGPTSSQERREKQIRVEQLRGKMLVMKHSD